MSDEQRFGDGQDNYLHGAQKAAEAAQKVAGAQAVQHPLPAKQRPMRPPLRYRRASRPAKQQHRLQLGQRLAAHGVRSCLQPGLFDIHCSGY